MARTNRFGGMELPDIGRYGHDVGAGYEFNPYDLSGDARFQPGAAKVNVASILESIIPKVDDDDDICLYGTYADGTCKPPPNGDKPDKPTVIKTNGEVIEAPSSFYLPGLEGQRKGYVGADPTWAGGGDYPFKGAYGQPVGWTDKEGKAPYYTKSLLDEQKRMAGSLGDIKDPVRPDFSVGPGAELETVYEDPESYVDLGREFLLQNIYDQQQENRFRAGGLLSDAVGDEVLVGGGGADKLTLLAAADASLSKKSDSIKELMKQENARIAAERKRIADEKRKAEEERKAAEAAEKKRQQEEEAARRQAEADEREARERERARDDRERAIERKEKDARNRAKEKAKKQSQQKSRKAAAKRRSDRASARSKAESSRAASQAAAARAAQSRVSGASKAQKSRMSRARGRSRAKAGKPPRGGHHGR